MEDTDTDTLRKLAPSWTLAGDERLLTILQNTHQRLITKCQVANTQLEQMATALDDANISLQNVNNRFMALSSTQFVERRVYDDDDVVTTEPQVAKESPKPPPDELSILKRSIAVIEKTHEVITILQDSDTESDTDDELPDRMVMKPKDIYADRPLPYIIGSEPWKNKWHAGLMREDSDSDSSTSKVDQDSEQYSQSEPEDFGLGNRSKVQDITIPQHVRQLSETSSELPSEATPNTKPTPSDVASEIARRLGGGDLPSTVVEHAPDYDEPPKPSVRKVYKPQEPVASTIFPDEPPPLDYQTDSDTDIFADLHRNQPYNQPHNQYVTDQLFGGNETDNEEGGDIFTDFANQPKTKTVSLFEAGPTPHMFDKQRGVDQPGVNKTLGKNTEVLDRSIDQAAGNSTGTDDVRNVKKPVGGISLFGSNKGTENIGAAILKRNRRQSNTSSDEGDSETKSPVKEQAKKEKDIFDDLFAKSETKKATPKANNVVNDINQEIQNKKEEKLKQDTPRPIDLFSDNLFDDIDDIFTINVVKDTKDKQKSIFEDDDDLFSEVADTKPVQQNTKTEVKKGLFDSDDDLFCENVRKDKPSVGSQPQSLTKISTKTTVVNEQPNTISEISSKNIEIATALPNISKVAAKSIFDDDVDDIFTNIKSNKENSKAQNTTVIGGITKNVDYSKSAFKSPSLFDDDDDENGLFTVPTKSQKNIEKVTINKVFIDTKPRIDESNKDEKLSIEPTNIKPKMEDTVSEKNIPAVATKVSDKIRNNTKTEMTESKAANSVHTDIKEEIDKQGISKQYNPTKTDVVEELKSNNNILSENTLVSSYIPIIDGSLEDNNYDSTTNVVEKDSVKTNNLNINTKPTQIQKLLEETTSNHYFGKEEFNEEFVKEKSTEISNTTTDTTNNLDIKTPNDNIKETLTNTHDNVSLEKYMITSPTNIPGFEKTIISNKEIPDDVADIPDSDIFTDIISEPPDFEKPKEPKKSKNVNALFDDDSDDETLFFKRDDVITDEKPEDFTVKQDSLFDMFTNEPPDEDFTNIDDDLFGTLPKPKLPSEEITGTNIHTNVDKPISDVIHNVIREIKTESSTTSSNLKENIDELITNSVIIKSGPLDKAGTIFNGNDISKPEHLLSKISDKSLLTDDNDDDDELFTSLPIEATGSKAEYLSSNAEMSDELFTSLPPNLDRETSKEIRKPALSFKLPTEPLDSSSLSEVKKVGKLKVGLNINVTALLPGASPKKVKAVDNTDGTAQQSQFEIKKTEPTSFDEEPESTILDNKLSKERPRIQVKRRPSTRKARKEAVRKSGINFGDDSTDNSSSIDDPPKKEIQPEFKIDNKMNNEIEQPSKEDISTDEKTKDELKYIESKDLNVNNENPNNISIKTKTKADLLDNRTKIGPDRHPVKSDSTTKIVYILNDEDIFNTSTIEDPITNANISTNQSKENAANKSEGVCSNVVDSDHLNLNMKSESAIKTLGNTYQSIKHDDNKKSKSLFGEDEESDDDEIFRNKKTAVKSTIFDSDSEGDLFGSSKKAVSGKKEKVIKEVKGPLFGDEDDDYDLFGIKTNKSVEPQQSTKSSAILKETLTATEPVFEDPLSMFGDQD